ncbi:MAG: tRNA threonylcarbamoyladenosine dehydratase [Oscillospiraceae bacterium]|nr:tRNA threonylcarbamoyladenosine dehydratase [Oscillospiraceae bacterium]
MERFSRTRFLLGDDGMQKLKNAHVAVFGLGGVGGYVAEALARSGIGALTLVDHDTISLTNINRQILATRETVGQDKVLAAAQRVNAIDPEIRVDARKTFYLPETADTFDFSKFDYVVDAIDTVTGKMMLIQQAKAADVPIISSMGTGNKLDPTAFQVADISKTSVCPLARIIRKECKKRGIDRLKVVYSTEDPIKTELAADDPAWAELPEGRNALPGSVCFVPAVAGMIIAGEVIKDIIAR